MERVYENTDEIADKMTVVPVFDSGGLSLDLYLDGRKLGRIDKYNNEIRTTVQMADEKQMIDRFDYTGNESFTRRDSVLHYYLGLGRIVVVNFNHFDNGIKPGGFKNYKKLVHSLYMKTETLVVDEKQVQSIGGWAGHVTFSLKGTITSTPYEWKFSGHIGIDKDRFNFDEKSPGERTYLAETITWLIREKMPLGRSYDIKFKGNRNVTDGKKWTEHPYNFNY